MEHYGRHLEFHSLLVCGEAAHTKVKSLTASATVVQTISNKFTAVVSNVVKWLEFVLCLIHAYVIRFEERSITSSKN